jgi:hypothetical protein
MTTSPGFNEVLRLFRFKPTYRSRREFVQVFIRPGI